MSLAGAYLIHWLHPERRTPACNGNLPRWATTTIGSQISCYRCGRLHSRWMHKQLAMPPVGDDRGTERGNA